MTDSPPVTAMPRSRKANLGLVFAGSALFLVSAFLLRAQATSLAIVKNDALPLAAELASLESRLSLLKEQISLTQQSQAQRRASLKEQFSAYILPERPDQARAVAVLESFFRSLKDEEHLFATDAINMGGLESSILDPSLHAIPFHLGMTVDDEGLAQVLALLSLSGTLTVGDVLTQSQTASLTRACTEGNPANAVALEQFLSLDLLSQAMAPDAVLQKFLGTVSSDSCAEVARLIVHDSHLPEAARLLGGSFGTMLRQQNLWPMPYFAARAISLSEKDGHTQVSLQMEVIGR